MTSTLTPPCDQVCWEWVGHTSWRYVLSHDHCGHWHDPHTRRWTWTTRPTTTPQEQPA